jgi:hypothetical protein
VVLAPLYSAQRAVEVKVDLVAATAVASGHGPLSPAFLPPFIPPA